VEVLLNCCKIKVELEGVKLIVYSENKVDIEYILGVEEIHGISSGMGVHTYGSPMKY
jgi:hypothetical protein